MRRINIENPNLENTYLTDIASDYSSGTNITVRSTVSFAINDLAVFGNPTEELTELKKILSLNGITGFVLASALNFQHNKGTPIYKSLWDLISIEGRSTSNDSFAEITQSAIQWDNPYKKTVYFHQIGTSTWQYRFRFYNSVTGTYSEYSPTLSGTGFTVNQMGYLIQEAREIAGDKNGKILKVNELIRLLNRAKRAVRGHNPRYWFWRVDGYVNNIAISANSGDTIFPFNNISNFGTLDYIEVKYDNGGTREKWLLRKKTDVEFLEYTRDLKRPNSDFPHFYRLLPGDTTSPKGYFEIERPVMTSGYLTFYPSYYMEEPDYTSVSDTTLLVYPEIYIDYLVAQIYATKENDDERDRYMKLFNGPANNRKTLGIDELTGIALLDELDRQSKVPQGQPRNIWRFRGQKAISRLYGNRIIRNPDYIRENYFDGEET